MKATPHTDRAIKAARNFGLFTRNARVVKGKVIRDRPRRKMKP
jgi:hypothetical protein